MPPRLLTLSLLSVPIKFGEKKYKNTQKKRHKIFDFDFTSTNFKHEHHIYILRQQFLLVLQKKTDRRIEERSEAKRNRWKGFTQQNTKKEQENHKKKPWLWKLSTLTTADAFKRHLSLRERGTDKKSLSHFWVKSLWICLCKWG